jgi:hypothetical protein
LNVEGNFNLWNITRSRGGKDFGLLGGDSSVTLDEGSHDTTSCVNTKGKRGNIKTKMRMRTSERGMEVGTKRVRVAQNSTRSHDDFGL